MPDTIKKKESIIKYIDELKDKLADLKSQIDNMDVADDLEPLPSHPASNDEACDPALNLQGTETILVVDDEILLRDSICRNLERYGYRVLDAKDAESALSLIDHRDKPVDLLLTDIVMPGMSVQTLVKEAQSRFPEMKIIFMSGYSEGEIIPNDVFDVLQSEAVLLKKPFFSIQLTSKIRETLDKA